MNRIFVCVCFIALSLNVEILHDIFFFSLLLNVLRVVINKVERIKCSSIKIVDVASNKFLIITLKVDLL